MKRLFTLFVLAFHFTAANALLWVNPSSVSFFDVTVGNMSPSQTVTVTNGGSQAVQVIESSSCFSDFQVMGFCNGTLQPYMSCTLNISFSPRQEGYQSCSISISDTSGSGYYVSVSGHGVRRN